MRQAAGARTARAGYNALMRLLIDGYNLLHATDLFGRGSSAGTLHGSREALLTFLGRALSARERRETTIVFDAAGAPPGLPRTVHFDHITVRFARGHADADELLEEILEEHNAPRSLLVVSSDHRVQRAARRRGAKYVDSEPWFAQTASSMQQARSTSVDREKPLPATADTAYWVKQFETPEVAELESRPKSPKPDENLANPFPPGYADDLLENEGERGP